MHREEKAPVVSTRSNHKIHVMVNNCQVEHQSTMVELLGKINNVKLIILFGFGATNSLISPHALGKCGLVSYKKNDFR